MRRVAGQSARLRGQQAQRLSVPAWSACRATLHAAAGLLCPCLDVGEGPDLADAQRGDRCREVRLGRELGDPLPAQTEQLRDLGSGKHGWRLHESEYIGNPPIDNLPIDYLPSRLVDKSPDHGPSLSANTMTTTPHALYQAESPRVFVRPRSGGRAAT